MNHANKKTFRKSTLLVLACAFFAAAPASAAFIVDTGPGPQGPGYTVAGADAPIATVQSVAGQFTIGSAVDVGSVQAWMYGVSGDLSASIYGDVSGIPATAALFSQSFTVASGPATWQGPTGLNWSLPIGTYWAVFEGVGTQTGYAGVPFPLTGGSPLAAYKFALAGPDWYNLNGSFGVQIADTAPVPLPAAAWLLLSGLAGVGAMARRRALQGRAEVRG